MNITVTKDTVTISNEKVHKGEFNINELNFQFSQDYTNNLVKKVVFTTQFGEHYAETIADNKATIPYEVLTQNGNILLGVYAYETSGDELVLRYSPKPTYITMEQGSWVEAQDGTTQVPALTLEQYEQALNQLLSELDRQQIINEIVTASEETFNTYYEQKKTDFDDHVTQKTTQFDEHINEYEKTWRGTMPEYESLTKDNNTQYYIEEV